MELQEVQHKVTLRLQAISKAARDLQLAFKAEKKAVDWLLKEFAKVKDMQAAGQIDMQFVAPTQASMAWLNKVGTEEQIRLGLPWANGTASLDPSQLKPLAEVFEYNFSNILAVTPESDVVEKLEAQAEWEAEQAARVENRHKSDMVKIALRRAVSEDYDPEDDDCREFIVVELEFKHGLTVDEVFVKEVLTEMGYFDPNVQQRD